MTKEPLGQIMENGRKVTAGDLLHFLEIAVLLISIGYQFQKFQQLAVNVSEHTQALTRIERYLGSQDKDYWRKAHQNGADDPNP